ncbi:MAG: hypothetical protein OI74_06755 [Gammaproteobacteria bacterium (ex Lamellibrachia satsuma)]|nr:MAG: PEP-CTERM sorting domain-containing protein [Gammaproteobacteria bacterium (ex Lamellibrachia satsuma)]RRS33755.1 MAG: hypothetical protein OI74_06755 [Gammaproteobacteria bacterium (ex Lamellibrachia satsuma)]RRS37549.1 MAG: hypothetical protein NV67_00385 [Gammaproteobacteria bacterium (ex Lamellibrachia satsuma)]
MKKVMCFILFYLLFLVSLQARTITLSLEPYSQEIPLGEFASLDIVASGIPSGNAIGDFDLDVLFHAPGLLLTSWELGTFLGDPNDPSETLVHVDNSVTGIIRFFEVSWLLPSDLIDLQKDELSLTLATLTFKGLQPGGYNNRFDNVLLHDAWFAEYQDPVLRVAGISVPEPSTLFIFSSSLLGMVYFGRKLDNR